MQELLLLGDCGAILTTYITCTIPFAKEMKATFFSAVITNKLRIDEGVLQEQYFNHLIIMEETMLHLSSVSLLV